MIPYRYKKVLIKFLRSCRRRASSRENIAYHGAPRMVPAMSRRFRTDAFVSTDRGFALIKEEVKGGRAEAIDG